MTDIPRLKAYLQFATPAPWQRSYFVDSIKYRGWSDERKALAQASERQIIRGPGAVGTPECNPVMRISHGSDADIDLIVEARNALPELIEEVESLTLQRTTMKIALEMCRGIFEDYVSLHKGRLSKEGDETAMAIQGVVDAINTILELEP